MSKSNSIGTKLIVDGVQVGGLNSSTRSPSAV